MVKLLLTLIVLLIDMGIFRKTFRRNPENFGASCSIPSKSIPSSDLQTYLDAGITPQSAPFLHYTRDESDDIIMSDIENISALAQSNTDSNPNVAPDNAKSTESINPSTTD